MRVAIRCWNRTSRPRPQPVSLSEIDRRHALVRGALATNDIDALIVYGAHNLAGGGCSRWFLGTAAAAAYTGRYEGDLLAAEITSKGYRKVGFVGEAGMPHGFVDAIRTALPDVRFEALDDEIDTFKALKSKEEAHWLRKAARMQDELFEKACAYVRPGLHDYEIMAYSDYLGQLAGSETGYFLGSSAPSGTPTDMLPRQFHGRQLEAGDVLLRSDETMTIASGMNIGIHPNVRTETCFVTL